MRAGMAAAPRASGALCLGMKTAALDGNATPAGVLHIKGFCAQSEAQSLGGDTGRPSR